MTYRGCSSWFPANPREPGCKAGSACFAGMGAYWADVRILLFAQKSHRIAPVFFNHALTCEVRLSLRVPSPKIPRSHFEMLSLDYGGGSNHMQGILTLGAGVGLHVPRLLLANSARKGVVSQGVTSGGGAKCQRVSVSLGPT